MKSASNLSNYEMDLVPLFKRMLRKCKGAESAMTARMITEHFYDHHPNGSRMTDARVRKIINYIRVNRMVRNLIASSKGYYIEIDKTRVRVYVGSLRTRAKSIMQVANSYSI